MDDNAKLTPGSYLWSSEQTRYVLGGITPRWLTTLTTRRNDPLPIWERGRRGQAHRFDPRSVVLWAVRQKIREDFGEQVADIHLRLDQERAQLAKSQRELIDMRIRERAGELVERSRVETTAFMGARTARDRILALADRLAPILAAETDERAVYEKLKAEGRAVCIELAQAWDVQIPQ